MNDVRPILDKYSTDCQPRIAEPLGSAGGLSGAQFWRICAPRGDLLLRRWPIEHPSPERLQWVHDVLRHVSNRGLKFVPVPIAASSGATFVRHGGHLWELAPWLPGAADYERSPRLEKLEAAMRALAQFHNAAADYGRVASQRPAGAAPAVAQRLARLRGLQSGGIDLLARSIDDSVWQALASLGRQLVSELPSALPQAIAQLAPLEALPLPLQPCIRDVWQDHVLFKGDTVTGLIDFGAMQVDTPAADIARLLGSLVGDQVNSWRIGLAAYSAVRRPANQERTAVTALDGAGTILASCNWIRWIYIEGRRFDDMQCVTSRFSRLLDRLVRIHDVNKPIHPF